MRDLGNVGRSIPAWQTLPGPLPHAHISHFAEVSKEPMSAGVRARKIAAWLESRHELFSQDCERLRAHPQADAHYIPQASTGLSEFQLLGQVKTKPTSSPLPGRMY